LEDTFKETQKGRGICVGRIVPGIEVRVIKISDDPITQWTDALELQPEEIGEIIVKGPWVTRCYFNRDDQTQLAKIKEGGSFWHRMGDVGYFDGKNRLWFCGRKNQRIRTSNGTLFTIPCEAVFNTHPKVKRSALVGIGVPSRQKPVIIIEQENPGRPQTEPERNLLEQELIELGNRHSCTRQIRDILFYQKFPVDMRHNAKISREQLAEWASGKFFSG
jgi:acyl-CoA synthetase (AMP-forming)/AMP-acid ligase II